MILQLPLRCGRGAWGEVEERITRRVEPGDAGSSHFELAIQRITVRAGGGRSGFNRRLAPVRSVPYFPFHDFV